MTTGRINQVTRLTSRQRQPPDANPRGAKRGGPSTETKRTCEVRRLLKPWAQGPPNNQQISQTVRRQFISQSEEKRVARSERGDHNDAKINHYGRVRPMGTCLHAGSPPTLAVRSNPTLLTIQRPEEEIRTSKRHFSGKKFPTTNRSPKAQSTRFPLLFSPSNLASILYFFTRTSPAKLLTAMPKIYWSFKVSMYYQGNTYPSDKSGSKHNFFGTGRAQCHSENLKIWPIVLTLSQIFNTFLGT